MKWEKLEEFCTISRAKIPWGWLVMSVNDVMTPMNTGYDKPEMLQGYEWRSSITFVFDPFHWWKL